MAEEEEKAMKEKSIDELFEEWNKEFDESDHVVYQDFILKKFKKFLEIHKQEKIKKICKNCLNFDQSSYLARAGWCGLESCKRVYHSDTCKKFERIGK
jgi:hypothetical protein